MGNKEYFDAGYEEILKSTSIQINLDRDVIDFFRDDTTPKEDIDKFLDELKKKVK